MFFSIPQFLLMWTSCFALSNLLGVSAYLHAPFLSRKYHANLQTELSLSLPATPTEQSELTYQYSPIFSFDSADTVSKFDRIDDVIMGGVSTSTLMDIPTEPYAKWFGMCRTTGGGFCGIRTLPFAEPLNVSGADGFYLTCRLRSDNEPERRAWKMSTRIKPDRGEQLYQARFSFNQTDQDQWSSITIPFDSFCLVRGPRAVPDSPPFNVTGGVYQIGMTMSKFDIGQNVTEVKNFRDGPFELQIKEIGVYRKQKSSSALKSVNLPKIYTKEEAKQSSPLLLKALRPISKVFFTEQSQRRKVAMEMLRKKRNMTRVQAILFGLKSRATSSGWFLAITKSLSILSVDVLRSIGTVLLRLFLFYPIRLAQKLLKMIKSLFRPGTVGKGARGA